MNKITVIGAGLAGCEAAHKLSSLGFSVRLCEMKPEKRTPAQKSDGFAELVCSNSLKAMRLESAAGLLKEEMRRLGSLTMEAAKRTSVAAGGALAVDRELFSEYITDKIKSDPNIEIVTGEVTELPSEGIVIVATGPLTSDALAESLRQKFGGTLSFFDAVAPIVAADSIDMDRVFMGARYDRGEADYINCPMERDEYDAFYDALVSAERAPLHDFDVADPKVYEGCMPIEVMAGRGRDTLRYGPLRPVGLIDPHTGRRPWANIQLRKENAAGTMYNIVGFQTNLKFGEQKRVFSMIPGLENAEFVRYGVMHRNSFLQSPKHLTPFYSLREREDLFFAGQLTGVEGYVESASSGLAAGINLARLVNNRPQIDFTRRTAIGALAHYVSEYNGSSFQPMNANFGIMETLPNAPRDKRRRFEALSQRALQTVDSIAAELKQQEK